MAFNFVIREDKVSDLGTDLRNASDKISEYVTDIYNRIDDLHDVWYGGVYDAFVRESSKYREHLDMLSTLLIDFADIADDLGTKGGSLIGNISLLLDVDGSSVSNTSAGMRAVVSSRSRDYRGVLIPTEANYQESISIPSNTTLSKGQKCSDIGNGIYDSTVNTGKIIDSEISYLKAYKSAHLAKIEALSEPQRGAALNYLNSQIVQRENIANQIDNATKKGAFVTDGAIFNATSQDWDNWYQGNDQKALDKAVQTAKQINNDLDKLSAMGSIEAYFIDCGIDK